ncbi:MAG: methionyl-tRNA formyltransferase [Candidatus Berkiellales bacterium]
MKVAFAGTPEFAKIQLQALLESNHQVVVVYTQPDKPAGRGQHLHFSSVKTLALQHGLPVEQPTSLKSNDAAEILKQYQPDVMIVAAYGMILPPAILALPRFGCINVHASLLPRWRGASPIQQAILAGDNTTGITMMKMDLGLDTGDILMQNDCAITADDTAGTLYDKLALLGAKMLLDDLETLVNMTPQPQDPQLVTHASKISKDDGNLNWDLKAAELERQIRAFNPWPIAYSHIDHTLFRIWHAKTKPLSSKATPGKIIDHDQEGVSVATQEGALVITQGQLPGKKIMPMLEILKGHHELFAVGKQFAHFS